MKLRIAFFALMILAGCGETSYKGQAFVKSGDGTSKLADMEVFVASGKDLSNSTETYRHSVDKIAAQLQSASAALSHMKLRIEENNRIANILTEDEAQIKPIDPSILKSARSSLEDVSTQWMAKKLKLDAEITQLKAGNHPAIFLEHAEKSAVVKVKTDADGKFELKIKGDADLVVVAHKGPYYWYVTLAKTTPELILADSNLHDTKCATCYFTSEQTKALRSELAAYALEKQAASQSATPIAAISSEEAAFSKDVEDQAKKYKLVGARYGNIIETDGYLDLLASSGASTAQLRGDNRRKMLKLEMDLINYRSINDGHLKSFQKNAAALKLDLEKIH